MLNNFLQWSPTKIFASGYRDTWYSIAVASSSPENLAGAHDKKLLYLIDEAPGLKEEAYQVIEGALTQKGNRIALIGNPVRTSGYFFNLFRDPQGFETATFNSEKSSLVDPAYPGNIARRFGKDSNIYRIRVLGEFPFQGDDVIMGYDEVSQAMQREEAARGDGKIEIGCDVARYGDDRVEIYIRKGFEIIHHVEMTKQGLDRLEGTLLFLIRKFKASACKVDETGMGSGVVDNLSRCVRNDPNMMCDIVGVANNGIAIDNKTYENAGTEMYFQLRDKLPYIKIPNDEELLGELTVRSYRFHHTSGRILIQDKESLRLEQKKKGLAICSPDKSDALALTFYDFARNNSWMVNELSYDPKNI